MPSTVASTAARAHRELSDARAPMAKAGIRNADLDGVEVRKADFADLKAAVGARIEIARLTRGWTLDQLAAHLPPPEGRELRDARQVARWITGEDRAQFDILFACSDDEFVAVLYEQLAPLSRRYQPVVNLLRRPA
jgi:hypothetical protein